MLKKELEILIKPTICNGGFKYKKGIQGFSWTRKFQERREEILIGYRTFYLNRFQLYEPLIGIFFNEVETVVEDYLKKNNMKNVWGIPHTIQSSLHDIEGIDYSKFETRIFDVTDFNFVAEELNRIIEVGVMPFFEQYNTLEKVADLFANKTPKEIVPYIQGEILFPKAILILKMAQHEKFKEKLMEYREILLTYTTKHDDYKRMLAVYDDLFAEDLKNLVS